MFAVSCAQAPIAERETERDRAVLRKNFALELRLDISGAGGASQGPLTPESDARKREVQWGHLTPWHIPALAATEGSVWGGLGQFVTEFWSTWSIPAGPPVLIHVYFSCNPDSEC